MSKEGALSSPNIKRHSLSQLIFFTLVSEARSRVRQGAELTSYHCPIAEQIRKSLALFAEIANLG
jgi:hypothetical protein